VGGVANGGATSATAGAGGTAGTGGITPGGISDAGGDDRICMQNGVWYPAGGMVIRDLSCDLCTCDASGTWICAHTPCPKDGGAAGGGGADAAPDGPSMGHGRSSYLVSAAITWQNGPGGPPSPASSPTTAFTIVLDRDAGVAIVGAFDGGSIVPFAIAADGTVRLSFGFQRTSCGRPTTTTYQSVELKVTGDGRLSGTGAVQLFYVLTDIGMGATGTAVLTGVADGVPPTLLRTAPVGEVDGFTGLSLSASEPLPPDVRVILRGAATGDVPLAPAAAGADARAVFSLDARTFLAFGEQYRVVLDGVTDFAGNAARASDELTIATAPPPPLAAQDGFESLATTTFAGARIISGPDAPVISGTRSLFVPPIACCMMGALPPPVTFRLSVGAAAQTIRFTYRRVGAGTLAVGVGYAVGRIGAAVTGLAAQSEIETQTMVQIPGFGAASVGPVKAAEIALPRGPAEEVTFRRAANVIYACGAPRAFEGVIIDDLRAE
jgi:hypothetical protein